MKVIARGVMKTVWIAEKVDVTNVCQAWLKTPKVSA